MGFTINLTNKTCHSCENLIFFTLIVSLLNVINKTCHSCKKKECRYTNKILNKYNCLLFYIQNSWTIYDIFLFHFFYSNHLKWLFFLYALINVFVNLKKWLIYFIFIFWERKNEKGWCIIQSNKQPCIWKKTWATWTIMRAPNVPTNLSLAYQ